MAAVSLYPNASRAELEKMLTEAEAELDEYQDYLRTKPAGVWFHHSTGAWARTSIRTLKQAIRERKE